MYRIVYNSTDLWTPGTKDVISPHIDIELNTAGRLTFTLPPGHADYFNIPGKLKGTVEVYENNDLIWFGRPIELARDIKNMKPVYCEGRWLILMIPSRMPGRCRAQRRAIFFRPWWRSITHRYRQTSPQDGNKTNHVDLLPTESERYSNHRLYRSSHLCCYRMDMVQSA